jgi:hypothetical protein
MFPHLALKEPQTPHTTAITRYWNTMKTRVGLKKKNTEGNQNANGYQDRC